MLPSVRPGIGVEITREPVGVVGLITPWNFPIAIPAWKIAPALAYRQLRRAQAGRPRARLRLGAGRDHLAQRHSRRRVQPGDGPRQRDRRLRWSNHAGIDAISFTGSQSVGARIAQTCAENLKKFQLEMGGKNPQVVLDDADLATAVELCAQSAFFSTGQRCTASSRLIVTGGIYPKFLEALKARMAALKVDDALKAGTDIGPVSSQAQLEQDLSYVEIGKSEGARAGRRRRAAQARHRRLLHGTGPADGHERRRCGSTARKSSARWPASSG